MHPTIPCCALPLPLHFCAGISDS
uniref:Uncharacterized protein n=1 Tax=Rhizophora mucronata TaxID=61149 RepID=A0A2P2N197_RHIMU